MAECQCVIVNREEGESQREWLKRWMCQFHWMQTDYYQAKLQPKELEKLRLHLADSDTDE